MSRRKIWPVWVVAACAVTSAWSACGAAGSPSADDIIQRAEERFSTLQDYECFLDSETRLGSKSQTNSLHLWFKKPHLLRAHVIRGNDKGSEVALGPNGRVRAHKGGLLKIVTISMSQDDRRLRNLRGATFITLDWGSFYRFYRERAAKPGAHSAVSPRKDPGDSYEVTLTYSEDGRRMRELYRIDPKLWVMLEGGVWENDVLVDHVVFHDVKLNAGLEEKWFKL